MVGKCYIPNRSIRASVTNCVESSISFPVVTEHHNYMLRNQEQVQAPTVEYI
ncbi:hypothetical protein CAL7102_02704 [Dulcicalothrix desertica PCC 7102]|nr:hypothetical protein CAL7102_02704 [Dulcicalothrix desertica PCC 7102]